MKGYRTSHHTVCSDLVTMLRYDTDPLLCTLSDVTAGMVVHRVLPHPQHGGPREPPPELLRDLVRKRGVWFLV